MQPHFKRLLKKWSFCREVHAFFHGSVLWSALDKHPPSSPLLHYHPNDIIFSSHDLRALTKRPFPASDLRREATPDVHLLSAVLSHIAKRFIDQASLASKGLATHPNLSDYIPRALLGAVRTVS